MEIGPFFISSLCEERHHSWEQTWWIGNHNRIDVGGWKEHRLMEILKMDLPFRRSHAFTSEERSWERDTQRHSNMWLWGVSGGGQSIDCAVPPHEAQRGEDWKSLWDHQSHKTSGQKSHRAPRHSEVTDKRGQAPLQLVLAKCSWRSYKWHFFPQKQVISST